MGRSLLAVVFVALSGLSPAWAQQGTALVDTTSKEIGGFVSAQELIDTPSFNRKFAGYLGILPGVVATISATTFGADSISVAGQNVRNSAAFVERSQEIGTLEPGKLADIMMLEGNPLEGYWHLLNTRVVIKGRRRQAVNSFNAGSGLS